MITMESFKFEGANFRGLSIFLLVRLDVISWIGWLVSKGKEGWGSKISSMVILKAVP